MGKGPLADGPTPGCSSLRQQDGPQKNRRRANSNELLGSIKDLGKPGTCGTKCKLFDAINASCGAPYDLGRVVNVIDVIMVRMRSRYGATVNLAPCCGAALELKADLQFVTVVGC